MSITLSDPRLYTVRPFSKPARTDLKDVHRVHVSPSILLLHKLHSGDACILQVPDGCALPAIAWAAPEKLQDNVLQTSKAFQQLHNLKLGDKVSLRRLNEHLADIQSIQISEIVQNEYQSPLISLDKAEQEHWSWYLEYPLGKAEIISVGMIFELIELKGQKRSFKVEKINLSAAQDKLYRFVASSVVQFQDALQACGDSSTEARYSLMITREGIGGLARQLDQLNQRLSAYNDGLQRFKFPPYYRPRRGGILLHGAPGTGKTLLLRKLAVTRWRAVFEIDANTMGQNGNNSQLAINRIFEEAGRRQPSLVIIDRLEALAGKFGDSDTGRIPAIAGVLSTAFRQIKDSRILVVATTNNPSEIDESLRRPGCFEFLIEIPIPDSIARKEILNILTHMSSSISTEMLDDIGERTHGFVGADLDRLVQLAIDKAKIRLESWASLDDSVETKMNGLDSFHKQMDQKKQDKSSRAQIEVQITSEDFANALLEVRPTAMQEVFLETPKIRWSDIGGQETIKNSLKQAIEWPFQQTCSMIRLGISPKKGLLLYGPPGCSKTLTAQAVATEAGLNFLAIKGAEILSMYVGESERALREIFRKARTAAPSVIFFDEIDALGARQDGPGGGGGTTAGQGSLNVLTTLLNELDGIEALKGVFVLAATNKPEVLDPALMRPGRLDTILYVGPPDYDARLQILQIRLGKMDVADEVSRTWLAEATDGYSGAEIVSVCERAGYAALEEEVGTRVMQRIGTRHLEMALREVPRQITLEMRERYEAWRGRALG